MEYVKGYPLSTLLLDKRADYKLQIHYLKEVGRLLDIMDKIRVNSPLDLLFINDLHPYNFVIDSNTGELRTVDVDSCKIGDNKPFPAKFLSPKALLNYAENKYEIFFDPNNPDKDDSKYDCKKLFGYIMPDKNSDIYCYIISILNYLYGGYINNVTLEYFYKYISYLERLGVDKELIDAFLKIVQRCDNDLPIDALDSLTSEQIYRAKNNVFHKTNQ